MALVKIQVRRDTAANWTSVNPVLSAGEPGLETDTGRVKYGNGTQNWSTLPYSTPQLSDAAPSPVGNDLMSASEDETPLGPGTSLLVSRADHTHRLPYNARFNNLLVDGNFTAGDLTVAGSLFGGKHTHAASDVIGLTGIVDSRVAQSIKAGSNITVTTNATAGTVTISAPESTAPVRSVNGQTGDVSLTPANIGAASTAHVHRATTDLIDFPSVTGNAGKVLATDGSTLSWTAGGTGVLDGDRGDIVVSGSGSTWTFDKSVVSDFSRTVLANTNASSFCLSAGAATKTHTHAVADVTGLQAALDGKQASGSYATLVNGKVPEAQLPAFVDEIIEVANFAALPATGVADVIYITTNNSKAWRWGGTAYWEIVASPGNTDAVPEGTTNLYHTTTRAAAAAPVQTVAGRTGAITLSASDISGLSAVATTGDYASLTGRPSLALVATTGSYNDLTNKPTIPPAYSLLPATPSLLGGIKVGSGLSVTVDGTLSSTSGSYTLPVATDKVLGGVKQGSNVTIDAQGVISVASPVTSLPANSIVGLAKVATTGAYADLASTKHSHSILTDITDFPSLAGNTGKILSTNGSALSWITAPTGGGGGGDPYVLPQATDSVLGGVKIGSGINVSSGTISATASSVGAVASNITGIGSASAISNIVKITQAGYDALATKNASTLYIIVG